MTGLCNIKVYEIYDVPESCEKFEIDGEPYIRAPTLFIPGSDGAAHTQALEDNLDLEKQNHQCTHCKWHTKKGL